MAAKQLGIQVLNKIQTLISEIDKPITKVNSQRIEEKAIQQQARQKKFQNTYTKLCYSYEKRQKEIDKVLKDKALQKDQPPEYYKVTNKNTLKILSKNEIKPIHQRINQILIKKQIGIKKLQQQNQKKQQQIMKPIKISNNYHIDRRFNQTQLQSYRDELDYKNKQRIKKRNLDKLQLVKKQQIQNPYINQASKSLSAKRINKNNYSKNVFTRMMQYNFQQKTKHIELLNNRKEEEGNFSPAICRKSIQIAERLKTSPHKVDSSHRHSHCHLSTYDIPIKKLKSISIIKSPLKTEKPALEQNKTNLSRSKSKLDKLPKSAIKINKKDNSKSKQNKIVNRTPIKKK